MQVPSPKPSRGDNVVPLPRPDVPPVYLAMAAAQMHAEGRLYEQPGLKGKTSDGSDPITDKDMDLYRKGMVPPMKQETFKGGDEGPLNINPYPIPRGR